VLMILPDQTADDIVWRHRPATSSDDIVWQ